MHKQAIQSLVFGAAILGLATTAQAELTANVGVTTNYVFRGVTQTDDGFAVQGGVDYTHNSGFYAGAWASNVDFPPIGSGYEYDLYAGFAFDLAKDVKLDVGYITYEYTKSAIDDAVGNAEIFIGVKFKDFAAYYYNGSANNNNDANYLDLRYTIGLPQEIKMTLHYGHMDPDTGNSADDISLRFSKDIAGFNASLTLTTYDSNNSTDDDELFLTVTKSFDLMK